MRLPLRWIYKFKHVSSELRHSLIPHLSMRAGSFCRKLGVRPRASPSVWSRPNVPEWIRASSPARPCRIGGQISGHQTGDRSGQGQPFDPAPILKPIFLVLACVLHASRTPLGCPLLMAPKNQPVRANRSRPMRPKRRWLVDDSARLRR